MMRCRQDARPKVAFVLARNGRGGSESQAKVLVAGLRDAGVHVDVFLVEGDGGEAGFGDATVTTLINERRRGWRAVLSMAAAALRLRVLLARGRYDVVHAAMARAYVITPFAAPVVHRPRVVAWRRNIGIHLQPRSPQAAIELVAARMTSAVICNSEAVREHWVDRRHVSAARCSVIRNAIPDWRFGPVPPAPKPADVKRLVTLGGLKPAKGHPLLLEVAAVLAVEHDVEVVIVGEGECRNALVAHAERLSVRVVLPGHVYDPRPWLASADVYVHPSESEGMSNAILEAMALGLPIVATDVGGAREALGECALLAPGGDRDSLERDVRVLLEDRPLAQRIGDLARARAKSLFTVSALVEQHLRVYAADAPCDRLTSMCSGHLTSALSPSVEEELG